MENYINKDTIILNEVYKIFEQSVICPLCQNIYIKPVICMKCQSVFCKRCIENWSKNDEKCPNKCEAPQYNDCLTKYDILSKLIFNCVGCDKEIKYNDAEKHHNSCCPGKTSADMNKKKNQKEKMKKLSIEDIEKYKKENEIEYITGMLS